MAESWDLHFSRNIFLGYVTYRSRQFNNRGSFPFFSGWFCPGDCRHIDTMPGNGAIISLDGLDIYRGGSSNTAGTAGDGQALASLVP